MRLVEGVVRVHGRRGEDTAGHGLRRGAGERGRHGDRLVRVGVHERDVDPAGGVARGGGADRGNLPGAEGVVGRREVQRERRGALVDLEHLEGVVRRREQHLFLVGEDHRLEHVHHLRDVGHRHAVGVGVKDVEVKRGQERVAQRVLLVEETGVGAGLDVGPDAPLVDDEADLLLGVVLVHDRRVFRDQLLHLERVAQRGEILVLGETGAGALFLPVARGQRVIVQREAVHLLAGRGHELLGPGVVAAVGPAGDALDAVLVAGVVFHEGVIAAEIVRVELRPHVAAAAPALVADGHVRDLPRLVAAVGAAEVGHGGIGGRGHVLHPLHLLLHGAAADIEAHVRFDVEQLAQVEEFVRAEMVVLHHATPVGVVDRRTLLARADAVAPVILVGEAPARPAQLRHGERLQRGKHVVAVAPRVGNGRIHANPDALVDTAAEMLGELAVDGLVDDRAGLGGVDGERGGRRFGCGGEGRRTECDGRQEEVTEHFHGVEAVGGTSLMATGASRSAVRMPSRTTSSTT